MKPLKPSEEMSENEVRQYMVETKEWKKKIDDLTRTKESTDEEMVGLDVDPSLKEEYEESFDDALDRAENKIKNLRLQDKERTYQG